MSGRPCGAGKPPWWPKNEPGPGDRRHTLHDLPAGRGRFFRRVALLALALLMIGVCGAVALIWLAMTSLGFIGASPRGGLMLAIGGALGAAGAVVALVAVMRRVGLPLGAVMEGAERVAGGDYATRVAEYGPPPIRALARAFNTMTERLQKHDRLRRDLMADVAHELRTPLTVMQGRLEGLLDGVYPRDDEQLAALVEETHVLSRLIEDLRTVALSEAGALKLQKESTDVGVLVRDAVQAFTAEASERGSTLVVHAADDLAPLAADPVRIREVVSNLLANALRHTPPGGSIEVRVYEQSRVSPTASSAGGAISVDVRDTGSGMTPEEIERAFERFHKGSESRGSGLGLTIARGIVMAHGGEIHATSEPGGGTTMMFSLPRE
jgi:signal transduction histidine kinase